MNQAQCVMVNDYILKIMLSFSLRNRRNRKERIKRKTRSYRTLKQRQIVIIKKKRLGEERGIIGH